jgi:dolichol-phosphate mannosyltransferase
MVTLQCIFSGMILLALGAIGDYIAKIYEESKGRPLYVVAGAVNCDLPQNEIRCASVLLAPEDKPIQPVRISA